ncbi:peroxiredoxin [Sulfodiicoccus acidiphilus]|uniref:Peroxiredoxin n=1 Tax=Sulfodiicoccus acidiphilus TaxID=1670455 RepID=A0A348B1D3_9CREN|nr:DsrE/DsrF/DrsH-like family protein [Sulfodiicoccus acidiphilus]BBD71985.1 peroxiredoxin [Sulfodiicoccus acidiphilus]GGT91939.1 peroxiredoxin [Sulfodiicoccus acidiphilus]
MTQKTDVGVSQTPKEEKKKLSIIVFSGTMDRLMPVGILASGAASSGYEVNLFFTFWGLQAITKKSLQSAGPQQGPKVDVNYQEFGQMMAQRMVEMKYPSWQQLLREAKEVGEVKVFACSTSMGFFNINREDLADFVDDVVGVATFLDRAQGGETLFI